MHLLVISVSALTAFGVVAYYLWYLTWPVVDGKVIDVTMRTTKNRGVSRASTFRIVSYEYRYGGMDHRSIRQGLITKFGFSPRVNVGDTIRVSVCASMQSLSCPRRVRFDAMVVLSFVLVCALAVLLYWDRGGAVSP